MNHKIRWIAETALMLALLVVLQSLTRSAGQIVTGSCVNAVLAVTVLLTGVASGVTVAVISPVLAYLLGIAPQLVTVPAVMVGNTVFVVVLGLLGGNKALSVQIMGWVLAAFAKFVTLWLLVSKIICGLAASALLDSGALKPAMLEKLPVMFTWPQLFTALIGGGIALLIVPTVRKALNR